MVTLIVGLLNICICHRFARAPIDCLQVFGWQLFDSCLAPHVKTISTTYWALGPIRKTMRLAYCNYKTVDYASRFPIDLDSSCSPMPRNSKQVSVVSVLKRTPDCIPFLHYPSLSFDRKVSSRRLKVK